MFVRVQGRTELGKRRTGDCLGGGGGEGEVGGGMQLPPQRNWFPPNFQKIPFQERQNSHFIASKFVIAPPHPSLPRYANLYAALVSVW